MDLVLKFDFSMTNTRSGILSMFVLKTISDLILYPFILPCNFMKGEERSSLDIKRENINYGSFSGSPFFTFLLWVLFSAFPVQHGPNSTAECAFPASVTLLFLPLYNINRT